MMDVFDLRAKAHVRAPMLSGGMRRRLLLARALMHEPRLVILDEPTAGVDFELRLELWAYIRRLHGEGTTILLTTHYLEEAEELCEEIALIRGGRLLARDSADGPARLVRRRLAGRRLRQGDGVVSALRRRRAIAASSRLSARESHRVLKLWTQTIVAPILSSFLFILVFGLSLGSRIKQIDGVDYEVFIVPGPHHDGDDPGHLRQQLGVGLPGALRPLPQRRARRARCARGRSTSRCRSAASCARCSSARGLLRVRDGRRRRAGAPPARARRSRSRWRSCSSRPSASSSAIYANSWDHTAFVTNIVILPLTFLGGVFYSVDRLPAPWHEISHANPIFYLLNAVRYGFLGTSDVSVALSLGVTGALAAAMVAWSSWLFRTGHRLKP